MALVFITKSLPTIRNFVSTWLRQESSQSKYVAHYKYLLIQIILMTHICENDMIQIKDMFEIVATWLQFSTEEYSHVVPT